MIELSRSKKTYLGKTQDGRNKWALDCSIAPIVMRETGKTWEDIKPEFVIEGNKRVSKGTPYRLEIDVQGGRRIYPYRTDLTKYLDFPAVPLFAGLSKTWKSNQCIAKTANEDFIFGADNVAATFSVLFKAKPTFNKITFNVNPVGIDVAELLKPDSVPRIPRPRLIDDKGTERMLDWTWDKVNKQLSLELDFKELTFPVLLKNTTITPDPIIGASSDDASESVYWHWMYLSESAVTLESDVLGGSNAYWGGFRFVSDLFPTQGNIIDSCYIGIVMRFTNPPFNTDDINGNFHFQLAASSLTFAAVDYDITNRPRTTASVPWIQNDIPYGVRVNSPSLVVPAQELWDSYSPTAVAVIFRPNTDVAKICKAVSYDYSHADSATFHIEWHEPTPPPPPTPTYNVSELKDAIENIGFDANAKVVLPVGRTSDGKHQFIQVDSDGKVVTTT